LEAESTRNRAPAAAPVSLSRFRPETVGQQRLSGPRPRFTRDRGGLLVFDQNPPQYLKTFCRAGVEIVARAPITGVVGKKPPAISRILSEMSQTPGRRSLNG
jgi:hypothetical protein